MPSRKVIGASVTPEVYDAFAKVADAAHLTPTGFAALLISRYSELKQEFALHALTAIPQELFKARPGRPPKSTIPEERQTASAT
jgi:hypothetical protein